MLNLNGQSNPSATTSRNIQNHLNHINLKQAIASDINLYKPNEADE
jgi:hypothetical protein